VEEEERKKMGKDEGSSQKDDLEGWCRFWSLSYCSWRRSRYSGGKKDMLDKEMVDAENALLRSAVPEWLIWV
jgi:hypothetical protein